MIYYFFLSLLIATQTIMPDEGTTSNENLQFTLGLYMPSYRLNLETQRGPD